MITKEEYTKKLEKSWKEVEEKMGLKAIEEVKTHYSMLWVYIQKLQESRDNWKRKYMELKK